MTKKVDKDELGTELESLAVSLAKSMAGGTEPAKTIVDGFGKLTSYYAATRRLNLKAADPEDEGTNFTDIRNKIEAVGKEVEN